MSKFYLLLGFIGLSMISYGQVSIVEGRAYIAKRTLSPMIMDGKGDDDSWQAADWTSSFVDIEGNKNPKPYHDTKVKMLWDDQYFYFYAELIEPHIWAKLTQRDAVIFRDNDFEIFIDPDGDTHNYFEYEVNAFNTIWDLLLTKPYRDNGHAVNAFDAKGLISKVHIEGTINNPADEDEYWSVEVAIPWDVFHEITKTKTPPQVNDTWRVNFSRVQWETNIIGDSYIKKKNDSGKDLPERNWVWSPQRAVAMHEPEFWGIVTFSEFAADQRPNFISDYGSEEVRQLLYHVHRAQKKYFKKENEYIDTKAALLNQKLFSAGKPLNWSLDVSDFGYDAYMQHPFNAGIWWHINETGKLTQLKK